MQRCEFIHLHRQRSEILPGSTHWEDAYALLLQTVCNHRMANPEGSLEKEDERRTTNRSTKQRSRQITWLISIVVDVLWLPVASLDKGFSVKFTSIYSHIHRSGAWLPHTPRNNPLAIMSVNRQIFDEARPDVLWFQYVRISIVLKMPCCCGRCGARMKKWIWRENQVMASDWYVICSSS